MHCTRVCYGRIPQRSAYEFQTVVYVGRLKTTSNVTPKLRVRWAFIPTPVSVISLERLRAMEGILNYLISAAFCRYSVTQNTKSRVGAGSCEIIYYCKEENSPRIRNTLTSFRARVFLIPHFCARRREAPGEVENNLHAQERPSERGRDKYSEILGRPR
ncbi:hypothetical protein EVAR_61413_1 [Eumeta japonica]|uniref:Uncharacterized protein n=1 Tax=Eumeta variegata TaxID=151549 RepID=A0A4C1YY17_EUMVA|nr:hypothetical protein EVAR_61413_1 [Eumeta japonica]